MQKGPPLPGSGGPRIVGRCRLALEADDLCGGRAHPVRLQRRVTMRHSTTSFSVVVRGAGCGVSGGLFNVGRGIGLDGSALLRRGREPIR
jgi:hypothetical protein